MLQKLYAFSWGQSPEWVGNMRRNLHNVLRAVTAEDGDKETFSFVALLAAAQLNETAEEDRHYEKEWHELIRWYRSPINN